MCPSSHAINRMICAAFIGNVPKVGFVIVSVSVYFCRQISMVCFMFFLFVVGSQIVIKVGIEIMPRNRLYLDDSTLYLVRAI